MIINNSKLICCKICTCSLLAEIALYENESLVETVMFQHTHSSLYNFFLKLLIILFREMLEKSAFEMKQTIDQLEKRIDGIDLEGNSIPLVPLSAAQCILQP